MICFADFILKSFHLQIEKLQAQATSMSIYGSIFNRMLIECVYRYTISII